ncbi:MAG TPA: hypothetical protein VFM74_07105 [Candidatus Limnocylindria bacterium]|nr:hypothetical protein [Candidatus Limnocylindria bacterium]
MHRHEPTPSGGAAGPPTATEDAAVVWIDARHAVVVRWDDEPVLEWIDSDVPARRRAVGSVRRGPARPHGGGRVAGHGTENQYIGRMRQFFSEVADRLADLDHVEVAGRGLPHQEFAALLNQLADKSNNELTITTRPLTRRPSERQLAARLRRLMGRTLPRRTSGPYRRLPTATTASGGSRSATRADLRNQKPRHLPEREEIDLEVEMMLAGDHPMW